MRDSVDVATDTSEFSLALGQSSSGVVTNTRDDGVGSLRVAITQFNEFDGERISFAIPQTDSGYDVSTGTFVIQPRSALPVIISPSVMVDGRTQTTFGGNTNPAGPEIVLDGSLSGNEANGIQIASQGNEIYGLNIREVRRQRYPNRF